MLARARDVVESPGGRLVFVFLPGKRRYSSSVAAWDTDGYSGLVLKAVADLGIEVIDIHQTFLNYEDPGALFNGHYTRPRVILWLPRGLLRAFAPRRFVGSLSFGTARVLFGCCPCVRSF